MKPKVLILSRDSWNETNSSGNTLSNYFKNWDSESIANIYCRDEIPDNNICVNYFKISESVLINKLLRRTKNAGIKITKNNDLFQIDDLKREESEKKIYNFFRKNRWIVFLWAREIIWKLVNWRSKDLNQFLTDFEPEIIFSFSYDSFFMHDILYYIQFRTKAKVVLFHCDDLVTFRQYSYSPLFWINRILLRIKMNKSIKLANQNYCIIDEQLRIYKSIYNLDFKLLYKTGQFISMPNSKKQSLPLKFVYTGNIICGRIKSLIEIAKVLKRINQNEIKVVLYIYTANVISSEDYNVLINNDFVKIMGKVTYDEIPKILSDSDVLIHVESFEKKHMLVTSLSFSTKLVDYFEVAKPILALGWENASSIKYLDKNNIGFTVKKIKDLYLEINSIVNNLEELDFLGKKTWEFGQLHHNENGILQKFQEDLIKMR